MPDRQTIIGNVKRRVGSAHAERGVSPVADFVTAALADLDRDSPYAARTTLTGDGTDEYALGSLWTRGVSSVSRMLYRPAADYNEPPRDVYPEEYDAGESAADGSAQIRFLTFSPATGSKVIIDHAAVHALTDSAGTTTLTAGQASALEARAAALLLRAAAASVASTRPQEKDVDFALPSFSSAADAYRRLADDADADYRRLLGLGSDGSAPAGAPQISSVPAMPNHRNRRNLTHPARSAW